MIVTAHVSQCGQLVAIYATWTSIREMEHSYHAKRYITENPRAFLARALKEIKAFGSGDRTPAGAFQAKVEVV